MGLATKSVQDPRFEARYEGVRNPWAVTGIGSVVNAVAGVAIVITMLGLIVAAASLIVRFRRATGDERRQLRWLTILVVPLPALAVRRLRRRSMDVLFLRTVATGGFVALIPITAGLSVLRYRLYDVDHILSRAAASRCPASAWLRSSAGSPPPSVARSGSSSTKRWCLQS